MSYTSDSGPVAIIPRWVMDACKGQPWAIALFVRLYDHADRSKGADGGWTIGRESLAEELGTSTQTIDRAVKLLVDIGALEVTRNRKGKEWTWSRYFVRSVQPLIVNPQPEVQVLTGGPGGLTGDDIPENPPQEPLESSSLRSEVLNTQEAVTPADAIVRAYWDWFKAENGGQPPQAFMALRTIVKSCLKRDYEPDEILDALKFLRKTRFTAAMVIDRVGQARRESENRPSTASIPSAVIVALNNVKPWFDDRWPRFFDEHKAGLYLCVATLSRWGFGIGESMLRLAVAMHDPPSALNPVNVSRIDGIDRFNGRMTHPATEMERAYRNRYWRAS